MAKKDWKAILVPSCKFKKAYNGIEKYREIAERLGIKDIVEFEETGDAQTDAIAIGEIANSSNKKPLIIGLEHYLIAYIGKEPESTDKIIFDAHADDEFAPKVNELPNFFYDGSFVNFMKGDCYFMGIRDSEFQYKSNAEKEGRPLGKSILLRYYESERIAKLLFKNKIFLSLDTDVFSPDVTTAHRWSEPPFGYEGRMSFEQVRDLSSKIVQGRELVGMNIAEYAPFYDKDSNYRTINLIVDLLKPMI